MEDSKQYLNFKSWIDDNSISDLKIFHIFNENGTVDLKVFFSNSVLKKDHKDFLKKISKKIQKLNNIKTKEPIFNGRWELIYKQLQLNIAQELVQSLFTLESTKANAIKFKNYKLRVIVLEDEELININLNIWDDFDEDSEQETYAYFETDESVIDKNHQKIILENIKSEINKINPNINSKLNYYKSIEHFPKLNPKEYSHWERWELRLKNVKYKDIETLTEKLQDLNLVYNNYKLNIYSES